MSEFNFNELLERTKDKRQIRLFAVACCRNIWHLLTDQRSRDAIEVAEQFVDGLVTEKELNYARAAAWDAATVAETLATTAVASAAWATVRGVASSAAWNAARAASAATLAASAAWATVRGVASSATLAASAAEKEEQFVFLKDIIYQPSITLNPSLLIWNNSLLPKFATNIYTNRDFSLMPILADALEEANTPDIFIKHCRSKVHVKGCWLLDVLMGKR